MSNYLGNGVHMSPRGDSRRAPAHQSIFFRPFYERGLFSHVILPTKKILCPKRRKIICQFSCALPGSFLIFFKKFSAIQDASFAILKSIFEKLLFLGSYKGRGKKNEIYIQLISLKLLIDMQIANIYKTSGKSGSLGYGSTYKINNIKSFNIGISLVKLLMIGFWNQRIYCQNFAIDLRSLFSQFWEF